MFSGEYEYKTDAKCRLAVPPRFREQFAPGMVLAKGIDRCINAYPLPTWKDISESTTISPLARSKRRRINRYLFSSAFVMELDDQGRVVIPPPLRQYADIKESLVIAGVNDYLEIWSKELWDREQSLMEDEAWQIAEGMEERE